jgi:hypothetical protein
MSTATQNPPHDSSPSDSQPRRTTKKLFPGRISRKAPSVKTAIILKRLQGQDKSSISRDLGVARNTVTTILEENDVEQLMQDGQIETLRRVPAALRTLDARLEKNSENAALWLLDKCFDGKQISGKQPHIELTQAIQVMFQQNQPVSEAPITGSAEPCESSGTPKSSST